MFKQKYKPDMKSTSDIQRDGTTMLGADKTTIHMTISNINRLLNGQFISILSN